MAAWSVGVSQEAVDSLIAHKSTYSVPLPEPIRVAVVYSTRFPDERGEIVLPSPDIYADRRIVEAR